MCRTADRGRFSKRKLEVAVRRVAAKGWLNACQTCCCGERNDQNRPAGVEVKERLVHRAGGLEGGDGEERHGRALSMGGGDEVEHVPRQCYIGRVWEDSRQT